MICPLQLRLSKQKQTLHRSVIKRTMHLLSHHPERLLHTAIGWDRRISFMQRVRDLEQIQKITKTPLNLLTECWGTQCPYNRFLHPLKRKHAAQNAAEKIIQQLQETGRVRCVFWGSGGLLQELIVLHQVALAKIHGSLEVLLIDPLYDTYCALYQKHTHQSIVDQPVLKNKQSPLEQMLHAHLHGRFYQLIRWCSVAYPHLKFSWYCSGEYQAPNNRNDLIIAIDAQPEEASNLSASKLCATL